VLELQRLIGKIIASNVLPIIAVFLGMKLSPENVLSTIVYEYPLWFFGMYSVVTAFLGVYKAISDTHESKPSKHGFIVVTEGRPILGFIAAVVVACAALIIMFAPIGVLVQGENNPLTVTIIGIVVIALGGVAFIFDIKRARNLRLYRQYEEMIQNDESATQDTGFVDYKHDTQFQTYEGQSTAYILDTLREHFRTNPDAKHEVELELAISLGRKPTEAELLLALDKKAIVIAEWDAELHKNETDPQSTF